MFVRARGKMNSPSNEVLSAHLYVNIFGDDGEARLVSMTTPNVTLCKIKATSTERSN